VQFHDDPGTAVMFLSDAGGVGLNLQRAASACINLELPWNPAVLEQRIGRIYRLGQKRPIDVYNLVTEEGIEGRIARLLGQKKAVFSTLFDGTSEQVLFDGQTSFLEGVKKLVDAVPVPPAALNDEITEAATPSPEPADTAVAAPQQAGLQVVRLPDGGLRIDAPPELAAPLASLLESLAQALRAATPGDAREAAE
jgi:hypothetical protein